MPRREPYMWCQPNIAEAGRRTNSQSLSSILLVRKKCRYHDTKEGKSCCLSGRSGKTEEWSMLADRHSFHTFAAGAETDMPLAGTTSFHIQFMGKETRTHITRRKFQEWACTVFVFFTCGNAGAAAFPAAHTDSLAVTEKRDSIPESVITADKYAEEEARSQTGHKRLEETDFIYGNVVFSSPDLIKAIQNLPGVNPGTELMSGLYVHGGEGSDNLFLLDGVPMYQISHLGGLFSSFNTDVVDHLDFYKSGFPARYGGRMSSVVDVSTGDGDPEEYHGSFMIGLIDGRLQLEGPIVKGKTSFNVAFRRSWMDAVLAPVISIVNRRNRKGETIGGTYSFYDLNASVTHRFSKDNILSLRFYNGRDHLKLKLDTEQSCTYMEDGEAKTAGGTDMLHADIAWGNTLASLNWRYRILDNLKMRTILYYTGSGADVRYYMNMWEFDETEHNISADESNISRINDAAVVTDFSWQPSGVHNVRFGASYQFHLYSPSRNSLSVMDAVQERDSSSLRYTGHEFALYAEDEMTFLDRVSLNLGLRYAMSGVPGKVWNRLEPRLALDVRCCTGVDFRVSYTEMNQFAHLISTTYLDIPTNCWLPSTSRIAPMRSRQVAGGIYCRLPHNLRLNVEGWYKTMDNILEYSGANSLFPPLDTWETSFNKGKGRSYGLETEFGWHPGKLSLTAYYTLSWSRRKFDAIWTDWYSHRHDNRHKLTLMGSWKVSRTVDLYASWNYNSGGWMTVATHIYNPGEVFNRIYTEPNNVNLPDYHRLDLGANFRKTSRKGLRHIWNIGVYNAYCRKNVVFVAVNEREDKSLYGTGRAIFPIIPSFSYTLKF